jgi:hypothetical protein
MKEPTELLEEKYAANPPSWRINYQCFFTDKNRVVTITCSSFEMVLQTTKHTMIYPGLGPSLEVIAIRPAI